MDGEPRAGDGGEGDEGEGHEVLPRELPREGRGRGEEVVVRLGGDVRGRAEAAREVVPQRAGRELPYGVRARRHRRVARAAARAPADARVERVAERGRRARDVQREQDAGRRVTPRMR